jgi:hypothetical protein
MVGIRFRMWSVCAAAPCLALVIAGACGGQTEVTGSGGSAGASATVGTSGGSTSAGGTGDTGGSSGVGGAGNGGSAGIGVGGSAGRDGGVEDAGSEADASDAPSDAPFSCGAATCAADQFCVHPSTNSCGAVPQCVAMADAGACPAGTMFSSFCIGNPTGGCVAIPMRGAPHCVTITSTCGPNPSMCSCLSGNACGPNGADFCQRIEGREIYCVCLAP